MNKEDRADKELKGLFAKYKHKKKLTEFELYVLEEICTAILAKNWERILRLVDAFHRSQKLSVSRRKELFMDK